MTGANDSDAFGSGDSSVDDVRSEAVRMDDMWLLFTNSGANRAPLPEIVEISDTQDEGFNSFGFDASDERMLLIAGRDNAYDSDAMALAELTCCERCDDAFHPAERSGSDDVEN
ncbi:MAG TPA: hypothetical protein VJS39_09865 [Gemmatimonadaceae bacterium]|nr:hypothetical protein [Gemmatimonadaceae bacterium]